MRWSMLLSALLHVLAVLALKRLLIPAGGPHPPQENPSIRVFLADADAVDQSLKAEVPSEIPSPGQESDGLRTHLVPEMEANRTPEGERVSAPPTIGVTEAPEPPDPRPPVAIAPQSSPSISPSRPVINGRRKDTAPKRTPAIHPQLQPSVQRQPEADQLERLSESDEPVRRDPSGNEHRRDLSSERAPLQAGSEQHWRFGSVPLLNRNDLDEYAKLPSSEQGRSARPLSGLDAVISLNTKDIRYLSYFAHLKRKIERVWSYPPEAVAGRVHGQPLLLFVLQRSGQVKIVELLRSSGSKVLDKEAWDAVIKAGPFDPFPPQIPQEERHIRARFSYVLDAAQQTTVQ